MNGETESTTNESEAVALHPTCSALHDTEHRDCIKCPHCGHEMDDSEAWGYPDVEWDEPGQCPNCEGHFQWSRFISVTYTTTPNGQDHATSAETPNSTPDEKQTRSAGA